MKTLTAQVSRLIDEVKHRIETESELKVRKIRFEWSKAINEFDFDMVVFFEPTALMTEHHKRCPCFTVNVWDVENPSIDHLLTVAKEKIARL